MKQIVLIEPQSREDHVYKTVRMPRLGLPLLGARLKAAGYRVNLFLGDSASLPWKKILRAELVGISTTTSTSGEAYRMAGFLRSRGIPVVLGGIHVTFMPDEGMGHADFLVRGEADLSFLPLVKSIEQGLPPRDIAGVSYREGGKIIHNSLCSRDFDLDSLPFPDLTLFDWGKLPRNIPVMTSRGCPFNCNFCSVTPMFGRRYRFRSTENVLEELSGYRKRQLFFCDDNFTANGRHSKELLRGIIDRKLDLKGWGAQVRADAARDEELLELMRRAGAKTVYIGLESINPATLQDYGKEQSVADIKEAVLKFHAHGMGVHGMFVFGGDSDGVQTIRDTVDFALDTRIDTVQFLTLTPLPGTPLFEKLEKEDRLLTRNWELYDGHHAVYQPALMAPEVLQQETIKAMKRFYGLKNVFGSLFTNGFGTTLFRGVGWWLVRHFERRNGRYPMVLQELQEADPKPATLLFKVLKAREKGSAGKNNPLTCIKISLVEKKDTLYLRLSGVAGRLTFKEINRSLRGIVPAGCLQLVVDTKNLRFTSDQAVHSFGRFLNGLGERVRRLQVIITADNVPKSFLSIKKKIPRFELLFQ